MDRKNSDVVHQELWVGQLEPDGDVLVYDASSQTLMPARVRLFSTSRNGWRMFLPDIVRSKLRKVNIPETIRSAVHAYSLFEVAEHDRQRREEVLKEATRAEREREDDVWIEGESQRRRDRTRSLNMDHLSRLGIGNSEYRLRAGHLDERTTRCWACKHLLDSRQELEHVLCGWIICSCGACGCGYHRA